jgi:hypothetical protein
MKDHVPLSTVIRAVILALILGSGAVLYAGDWERSAASVAYEGNKHTLDTGDFAWAFSIEVEKNEVETYGLRFSASQDFVQFVALDSSLYSRFYALGPLAGGILPFWQIDLGFSTILRERGRDDAPTLRCLQSLTIGMRIPLGERGFVEPYLRAGYPFLWGGGVAFGGFNRGKPQK